MGDIMNGIILINKEKDYTSRDVVNIISKELHTKKVGHTGTLDPLATGVLAVCVGEATKIAEVQIERLKSINATLSNLKTHLFTYINEYKDYTVEDIAQEIKELQRVKNIVPMTIEKYLENIIERMTNGEFKYKGADYDKNSIKVWNNFNGIFGKFAKSYANKFNKILSWETLDKEMADYFISFMKEEGYMTKSINKYIITFKAFINYAEVEGKHNNGLASSHLYKQEEIDGCTTAKTYLTDVEIQALYDMHLKEGSHKDKVRDIFLCGCYTGQRFSDYGRLSKEDFSITAKGTRVIRLVQEKTNNSVVIPILNNNLLTIAEKYNYDIPQLSDVIANRYIKEICKELSKNIPSLAEYMITQLTMKEKEAEKSKKMTFKRDRKGNVIKHRYDLISTHTARRSAITNLYKSRLFSNIQLMSISGHKSEDTFFGYISQSADELADEITKIIEGRDTKKATNEDLF